MSKDAQLLRGGTMIQFQAVGSRGHMLNHFARLPLAELDMDENKGYQAHPSPFTPSPTVSLQTNPSFNEHIFNGRRE